MNANEPIRITPSLQTYAWGDEHFIAELFDAPRQGPVAEAWFGAHPVAPAMGHWGDETAPLDRMIARHGQTILGERVHARFGRLPYLLKILAARRPLSIQVHPDRAQAAEGFMQEELRGVPKGAPERFYRDDQHKPELLVALTPMSVLCGFKPPEAVAGLIERHPELRTILPPMTPTADGLRTMIAGYYALSENRIVSAWQALLTRLQQTHEGTPYDEQQPEYWVLRAHRALGVKQPDRGLLFVFLLALHHLRPGQGVFLPAGVLHAYLNGAGVELMANSDNVLRAGLTPKAVSPDEVLRIARFDADPVPVRLPTPVQRPTQAASEVTATYLTPTEEFRLQRVPLRPGAPITRIAEGPETVLLASRPQAQQISVDAGDRTFFLRPGAACLVPDGSSYTLGCASEAEAFVAQVPRHTEPGYEAH